ncbi:VOC family protein [bacterium]|nr:VOC family protein [bacterium]
MSETINFHAASPILPVNNLETSIQYYCDKLGFSLDWKEPEIMASVSRGPCNLMLCERDQGHVGTWVWIGVGNSEALYEEFKKTGAIIRNPPTNYYWALEMQIQDPDGNVLRFGSDRKEGEPYGPWLDMNGKSWPERKEDLVKK